jgi:hypothetical protein
MLVWDQARRDDVLAAIKDYPHKAILGTAYEIATGQRLAPVTLRAAKLAPYGCLGSWDSPPSLCAKQRKATARP